MNAWRRKAPRAKPAHRLPARDGQSPPSSPLVVSGPTEAVTGRGESGFGTGEDACETATMSTVSSRLANCPVRCLSPNREAATEHSTAPGDPTTAGGMMGP